MSSTAVRLAEEAQAIFEAADRKGRALTADERDHVEGLLDRAKQHGEVEQRMNEVGQALGVGMRSGGGSGAVSYATLTGGDDPGSRFIQSEGFKAIVDPTRRPERWTTGLVDVTDSYVGMKGTLLEGAGAPGAGTGGGLVPSPQVVPGVVQTLFQPLTLESLLSSNVATNSTVRYVVEGTATSGAAGVAEGGLKPESTFGLSTKDEPVRKIATLLPVSEELAEDAPAVQGFINERLSLFVQIETERQLLRGTSGGNEVQGLLTSRNVPVFNGGTADTKAEQLFKAANSMRGSALIEPEWFVISPTDYQVLRLLKDTANQYLGGGPFMGGYGNPTMAGASGQISGAVDYVWNKPVYVTAAIGAGTALVGTRANASVYNRGGMRVEASNQHNDFFQRNLIAIRAERRLALAVYRSGGFVETRLAVGPGG